MIKVHYCCRNEIKDLGRDCLLLLVFNKEASGHQGFLSVLHDLESGMIEPASDEASRSNI